MEVKCIEICGFEFNDFIYFLLECSFFFCNRIYIFLDFGFNVLINNEKKMYWDFIFINISISSNEIY